MRRLLPVPYEYVLYYDYVRHSALPLAGGLLDQPYLLLMCFRIIDSEAMQAEAERRKLEEIKRLQVEAFRQKNGDQKG